MDLKDVNPGVNDNGGYNVELLEQNEQKQGASPPAYGGATVYDAGKTPNPMSTYFPGEGSQYNPEPEDDYAKYTAGNQDN